MDYGQKGYELDSKTLNVYEWTKSQEKRIIQQLSYQIHAMTSMLQYAVTRYPRVHVYMNG